MKPGSVIKDGLDKVSLWSDMEMKYDVKSTGKHQPKFVSKAINGFPAIDFSGADVGLVSDVKYSKGPNAPFTWIMAVQPQAVNGWPNIFSTSDSNWSGLNKWAGYYGIAATTDGIHGWSTPSDLRKSHLPTNKLTIYTIWYDGTIAKVYWNKDIKITHTSKDWGKGPTGYVAMGLGLQNHHHDYSGYIGEVLAYDVALESTKHNQMIDAMIEKWTTGASWKN